MNTEQKLSENIQRMVDYEAPESASGSPFETTQEAPPGRRTSWSKIFMPVPPVKRRPLDPDRSRPGRANALWARQEAPDWVYGVAAPFSEHQVVWFEGLTSAKFSSVICVQIALAANATIKLRYDRDLIKFKSRRDGRRGAYHWNDQIRTDMRALVSAIVNRPWWTEAHAAALEEAVQTLAAFFQRHLDEHPPVDEAQVTPAPPRVLRQQIQVDRFATLVASGLDGVRAQIVSDTDRLQAQAMSISKSLEGRLEAQADRLAKIEATQADLSKRILYSVKKTESTLQELRTLLTVLAGRPGPPAPPPTAGTAFPHPPSGPVTPASPVADPGSPIVPNKPIGAPRQPPQGSGPLGLVTLPADPVTRPQSGVQRHPVPERFHAKGGLDFKGDGFGEASAFDDMMNGR